MWHRLYFFWRYLWIFTLLGSVGLVGCSENSRRAELKQYISGIKAKAIRQIEPLPEVRPYESFTYNAGDLRSPFIPPTLRTQFSALPIGNGLRPDVDRRREPLEMFPLDSLRMIGTLEKNKKRWAVVKDTDGTVYRITKGNYVGQNYGKIEKITEEGVALKEIYPDEQGGWLEREASMTLVE